MEFVESCRKVISIDSSPTQGCAGVVQFFSEYAKEKKLEVEVIEEHFGDLPQANILIRPQNSSLTAMANSTLGEELMLQTHLDTPDPGPFGLWNKTSYNPFDAHIIDGNIYGLGSADVKLDFLCKIEALSKINSQSKLKRLPVLVGTYGEETGMTGSLKLIRKNKINAKWALVGEPSNLNLITSGKGMANVEIRIPFEQDEKNYREEHNLKESTSSQSRIFNGKASHSSTPHLGESAIKKMFEYLMQLPEDLTLIEIDGGVNFNTVPANAFLDIDLVSGHKLPMIKKILKIYKAICDLEDEFLQYQDENFVPAYPTLNIGVIRTFEDHVFISGNCRIPPIVNNEIYEKWMNQLSNVCKSVNSDFKILNYHRPFKTNLNSEFLNLCKEELLKVNPNYSMMNQSSTNEASLYSRLGIECLCFGAGKREGNIHTQDEHVAIKDLQSAIEFYKNVIERFCL